MTDDVRVSQRVAILVDVQNLYHAARLQHQKRVCYDKLLKGLLNGRQLSRAIAYVVQRPDVSQAGFLGALSRFGFDIRVKDAKMRPSDQDPSRVVAVRTSSEVDLTLDAMNVSEKADTIIIVSGDGCYTPLIAHLQAKGCRVEVAALEGSAAGELVRVCDQFRPILVEWLMPDKRESAADVVEQPIEDEERQPISNVSRPVFIGTR